MKTLKVVAYTFLALLAAFVVYANWTPAPMHAYVKPISMTILKIKGLETNQQASHIRQNVSQATGVTACSANIASKMVSITFDPDQTTAATLSQFVGNVAQLPVEAASFETVEDTAPQCPVPMSYILAFERVKYAFSFR